MNKIYIHKGDCTIFADRQDFLTFNIDTYLDLTGWKAKFILGWITKEIEDITSKSFEIVLGSDETKQLKIGPQYGSIILTDSNGNIKTVTNTIPFEVTNEVVENEYQNIDLTIPESSGIDIKLSIGTGSVSSVNGMTGNVVLNVATCVSELENDMDFATRTDIMSAIASIPQFRLSLVNELPEVGEQMVLYFVPKECEGNDTFNEYIWIEETASYEFVGSTAVDLTDYVKNTDIATSNNAGIVKVHKDNGIAINNAGLLYLIGASEDTISKRNSNVLPIMPDKLDFAVKTGITSNTIELTDEEKSAAQSWLGVNALIGDIETLLAEV